MPSIGNSAARSHAALDRAARDLSPVTGVVQEGKVIAIHTEDSTVDVALYGGQILRRVRVLFSSANTVAGFRYLASVANTVNAQNTQNGVVDAALLTHTADTLATIVYVEGQTLAPRVIGFSLPTDAQMHIDEQGLALFRHESGVYFLVDKAGHFEVHYPDGSYIVAGPDTNAKAMQSSAQAWNIPTAPAINMGFVHSSGSKIMIAPDGTVTIKGKTTTQTW